MFHKSKIEFLPLDPSGIVPDRFLRPVARPPAELFDFRNIRHRVGVIGPPETPYHDRRGGASDALDRLREIENAVAPAAADVQHFEIRIPALDGQDVSGDPILDV